MNVNTSLENITYRLATLNDSEKLVDFFFDVFLPDEPATKSRGGYSVRPPGLVTFFHEILSQGNSILAEQSDHVIGMCTNYIFERGCVSPPKTFGDYCWSLPVTHAYLMALSDRLWHPNDIFKQYPEANKIFFIHALATSPDHRKRGIAKNLVDTAFKHAQNSECQCVTVMATSPHSRRIFDNLDFQVLRYIDWKNFVDDYKNGHPAIFPQVDTSAHIKFL